MDASSNSEKRSARPLPRAFLPPHGGATEDIRLHGQTHPGARPDGVIEPLNPRYDHYLRGVLGLRQLKPLLYARHGPHHKAGLTRY